MICFLILCIHILAYDWTPVHDILNRGITERLFPGGYLAIADKKNTIYAYPFGYF